MPIGFPPETANAQRGNEMLEREPGLMTLTDFGWALESKQPTRRDLYWIPQGTKEIYVWDGDEVGWVRIRPPQHFPCKEINHG